jgi:hypothetical protein
LKERGAAVANALIDVQNTYLTLYASYDKMRGQCTTQEQMDSLDAQYEAAQKTYYATLNKTLEDDDAAIAVLSTNLQAVNKQVTTAVAVLGDMSKVIDLVTQAVTLGAQIAAAAGL